MCPQCDSRDLLDKPIPLPEGGWQFVCRAAAHGPQVFDVDSANKVVAFAEDLVAELDLYDDLRTLVTNEFQRVEYGVLEHMYGTRHRKKYDRLIAAFGHAATTPTRFTASSLIAGVLGRLRVLGELEGVVGRATGYWSHNALVTYWSPAGAEPISKKTWADFAAERDMDPLSWPLLGSTRAQRYWDGEFLALGPGDDFELPINPMEWDGRAESLLESVYQIAVNPGGLSTGGDG